MIVAGPPMWQRQAGHPFTPLHDRKAQRWWLGDSMPWASCPPNKAAEASLDKVLVRALAGNAALLQQIHSHARAVDPAAAVNALL